MQVVPPLQKLKVTRACQNTSQRRRQARLSSAGSQGFLAVAVGRVSWKTEPPRLLRDGEKRGKGREPSQLALQRSRGRDLLRGSRSTIRIRPMASTCSHSAQPVPCASTLRSWRGPWTFSAEDWERLPSLQRPSYDTLSPLRAMIESSKINPRDGYNGCEDHLTLVPPQAFAPARALWACCPSSRTQVESR